MRAAPKPRRWHLRSGEIRELVYASDQFEAWDTLRDRPLGDFGLVVEAEPDERGSDESYPIRTSILFLRWGRDADARVAIAAGIRAGLPDTTNADRAAADRSPR